MSFRAGDVVLHKPSGQKLKVAAVCAESRELVACGYPEKLAKWDDCDMVKPASDEEHRAMLYQVNASQRALSDRRNLDALNAKAAPVEPPPEVEIVAAVPDQRPPAPPHGEQWAVRSKQMIEISAKHFAEVSGKPPIEISGKYKWMTWIGVTYDSREQAEQEARERSLRHHQHVEVFRLPPSGANGGGA